jgi:concanavalin A-like lectin/glucanase superfamily protein/calcium-dependent phosphoinositide phospholipase C
MQALRGPRSAPYLLAVTAALGLGATAPACDADDAALGAATGALTDVDGGAGPRLIGHWSFDERDGQQALDASGLGHHGILGDSSGSDSRDPARSADESLAFNPMSYVRVPASPTLQPAAMSFELWLKDGGREPMRYALSIGPAEGNAAAIALWAGADGITPYVTTTSGLVYGPAVDGALWGDGGWHHIATTYDGAVLRFYVDGLLVGDPVVAISPIDYGDPATADLWLGSALGSYYSSYAGDLDDVRFYDGALSDEAIAAHARAGRPIPASCPQPESALRYTDVVQKSIHNAYLQEKDESILDQLVYYKIRNLEIDIHSKKDVISAPQGNDWWTYHAAIEDQWGQCELLSQCLRLLRGYLDANPDSEVLTITLEFKGWGDDNHDSIWGGNDQQTPEGLDNRLRAELGDHIFTPADFLARCPEATTLFEAARDCGWPTLEELRGRVLVFAHAWTWFGFHGFDHNPGHWSLLKVYGGMSDTVANARAAFIAPLKVHEAEHVDPARLEDDYSFVIVHTENFSTDGANDLRARYPGRVFRSDQRENASSFAEAQRGQNLINTDKVSFHDNPWSRVHNAYGYPFCPLGVQGDACWTQPHALSEMHERRHLLAVDVRSEDIEDSFDSFTFSYVDAPIARPTTWAAYLSSSNDDIDHWAKGCLMLRADLQADSPYYAVCRAGDGEQLFIQYRSWGCDGTCGTAHDRDGGYGKLDAGSTLFVKLESGPLPGGGVWVQGFGSMDGRNFHPIGQRVTFSGDLRYQGIAASSHGVGKQNSDGSPTRWLFGNVVKDGTRFTFDSFAGARRFDGHADIGVVAMSTRSDESWFDAPVPAGCAEPRAERRWSAIGWGAEPTVLTAADGRLVVVTTAGDGSLGMRAQVSPGSDLYDEVVRPLSRTVRGTTPTGIVDGLGRLHVVFRDVDTGFLYQSVETQPGSLEMGAPYHLGFIARDPAFAVEQDGRLSLFAVGDDGAIRQAHELQDGVFYPWVSLGGPAGAGAPTVTSHADGRLALFVRAADGAIWMASQSAPNGAFGAWVSLGGTTEGRPLAMRDPSGRIAVFTRGVEGTAYLLAETAPDSGTFDNGFEPLDDSRARALALGRTPDGGWDLYQRDYAGKLYHRVQGSPADHRSWVEIQGVPPGDALAPPSLVVGANRNGTNTVLVRDQRGWVQRLR